MKKRFVFIILEIVLGFDVGFQVCVGLINRLVQERLQVVLELGIQVL